VKSTTSIGEVLGRYFADRDYDRRRSVESMFDMWDVVIGEPECDLARPVSLEDGLLTLAAANPAAASDVSFGQAKYMQRVNAYFGGGAVVREVRVRVAPGQFAQSQADDMEPSSESDGSEDFAFDPGSVSLSAEDMAWVDEMSAHLADGETRKRYRSLLLTQLRRERWDEEQKAGQGVTGDRT
jgi:hypothetical protein